MLKQHNQLMNFGLALADGVAIALAWLVAYEVRFAVFSHQKSLPSVHSLIEGLLLVLTIAVGVFNGLALYKPRRVRRILEEVRSLIIASVFVWVLLISALYYLRRAPFTRGMLLIFLPVMMGMLILERGMFRSVLHFARSRGWNQRYALIVGTGRLGQYTLKKFRDNNWTGINVIGFVSAAAAPSSSGHVRGVPVVGRIDKLTDIVEHLKPDCVFVALQSEEGRHLPGVVAELEQTPVDVRLVPDLLVARFPVSLSVSELDGMPIVSLRENPLAGWPTVYKRIFDICGAMFGLVVFAIPITMIAFWIKVSQDGPIFYRQRRVSLGGEAFMILKFRTMVVSAEDRDGPVLACQDDPRCTPFGRWLRRCSLDELPQLWNVFVGHMSLVGPRPERPEIMEKIVEELPGFATRLKVRAGLTGYAQIRGFRGQTSFRKRLQYDLYYLNHWSPAMDIRIIFETLLKGFRHPNAY